MQRLRKIENAVEGKVQKIMTASLNLLFTLVTIIIFSSCHDESGQVPTLKTKEITEITKSSAISGGTILSDGGSTILEKGVCWGTSSQPTIADYKSVGVGGNVFTVDLAELTMGTLYYVRAYAINAAGTGYGDELTFYTVGQVQDVDGHAYDTVRINNQTWMVQNLQTTRFNDGIPIQLVTDNNSWSSLTTAAYCELNNDITNVGTYGRLYNFYVQENQKVCPIGWRAATDADWTQLTNYLGGVDVAGGKLKSNEGWMAPNFGPQDRSGFSAVPGGYRKVDGAFARVFYVNYEVMGDFGYWWTSTSSNEANGQARNMFSDLYRIGVMPLDKRHGLSVRCIKDAQ